MGPTSVLITLAAVALLAIGLTIRAVAGHFRGPRSRQRRPKNYVCYVLGDLTDVAILANLARYAITEQRLTTDQVNELSRACADSLRACRQILRNQSASR